MPIKKFLVYMLIVIVIGFFYSRFLEMKDKDKRCRAAFSNFREAVVFCSQTSDIENLNLAFQNVENRCYFHDDKFEIKFAKKLYLEHLQHLKNQTTCDCK